MKLSGWGRYPVIEAQVRAPHSVEALRAVLNSAPTVIARGNGRAYGDSAVNPSATIDMRRFNRMLAFDPQAGQLTAEAGVLLGDIITALLPRGWFPGVTPGTKFVTLGGMIAADVHGKNHHRDGSFRTCVDWIDVMGADGAIRRCSMQENVDLFEHTLGGMGLTGIIVRAAIRLRSVNTAWVRQTTLPMPNLKAAMAAFEQAQAATYSVAWIDCLKAGAGLGRSLIMLGEHAQVADLSERQARRPLSIPASGTLTMPFDRFPSGALNRFTVRACNALYYRIGARKAGPRLVDWNRYFYPLDAILGWNRIYGRKGFVQFQCVLPLNSSESGLSALLTAIAKAGSGLFLAVLKRFGSHRRRFAFPMEGYPLALDFPVTAATFTLLDRLDRITVDHGGRFYLAKDSRLSAQTLRAADSRVERFVQMREDNGWTQRFHSSQAARLSI